MDLTPPSDPSKSMAFTYLRDTNVMGPEISRNSSLWDGQSPKSSFKYSTPQSTHSILQALSALQTVSLDLSLLKRSRDPINPSNFLRALQDEMRKTVADFHFNQPQDVQEVLSTLVSLKRISPVASNLFSVTVKSITPCDICHCSETEEITSSSSRCH